MRNWLTFNGISSADYGVYISGSGTFNAPARDESSVVVPGRNGELTIDNGRYNNISVEYPAFIYRGFNMNVDGLRNFLLSQRGYKRLKDSYHPDEYRMARWSGDFEADVVENLKAGEFTLTFDCMPQRFYEEGDEPIEMTSGTILNRTMMTAKPLLRVYGSGTVTINGTSVGITAEGATYYTDIDCDLQEAYRDTLATNRNSYITLTNGKFPVLDPGENSVSVSGVSRLIIRPRWWHL